VYPFGMKSGTLERASGVDLTIDTKPLTTTTAQRIRHRDGWREEVRAHIASLVINPPRSMRTRSARLPLRRPRTASPHRRSPRWRAARSTM
jgi:hypothetical protein